MGFFTRYLGFGLLPLWMAIVVMLAGSIHATGEYWTVAPWLIVFAIPCCGISLAIVALISWATADRTKPEVVHDGAPAPAAAVKGSAANDRARAWIVAGVMLAFCMVVVVRLRYQSYRHQAIRQEQQELKSFVMNDATVLAVEPKPDFWMPDVRRAWDDRPFEYEVAIHTNPYLAAIVLATHANGRSSFRLECLTTSWRGQRDPRLGLCQRPLDTRVPPVPVPTVPAGAR